MAWEAMSPSAPDPAVSLFSRQVMGESGVHEPVLQVGGADVPDRAEPSFGNELPGQGQGRDAAVVEADHGLNSLARAVRGRGGHGFGLGQGVGQRLFHQDVLAGFEGRDGDFGVHPARRADIDDVDVVPFRITERQSVADSAQPYLAAASATSAASRPTSTFCSKAGTSKKLATFRHAFEWALPMKA